MQYFVMPSRDIRENLATEEYLLGQCARSEPLLLLYIQEPCVIIGRNQNAYEEVNLAYLQQHNIVLTRRISGGGAVYDDLGNLSFSYVMPKGASVFGDYQSVIEPIAAALNDMGVLAEIGGRNDMYIEGKKFSGNAMYTKKGSTYSHGTLMYDVNLQQLDKILTVSPEKIKSKASQSVRKQVTNIKPYLAEKYQKLSTEEFRDELICRLFQVADLKEIETKRLSLTLADKVAINELVKAKYAANDWIFGETPIFDMQCRQRFPATGIIDCRLKVAQGRIETIKFYGDFFGILPVKELEQQLVGEWFLEESFDVLFDEKEIANYFYQLTKENWLALFFN
ncbi:lipoate--protein ligase [Vagococcus vulneris]|uniref:lipoate--protein ligase n=1 Tax=Vagococcus vulneris TaxID=1977869 RepID=A0A430A0E7_9ENTE|nr:lipoate--protein ligase [Vagococcus vulneris]RST99792.1 lipoate--protein ligase [Vagococcus vulneris]